MHERDLDAALKPRPPHRTDIATLGEASIGQRVALVAEVTRQTGEGEHAATWVRFDEHTGRCCPHALPSSTAAKAEVPDA